MHCVTFLLHQWPYVLKIKTSQSNVFRMQYCLPKLSKDKPFSWIQLTQMRQPTISVFVGLQIKFVSATSSNSINGFCWVEDLEDFNGLQLEIKIWVRKRKQCCLCDDCLYHFPSNYILEAARGNILTFIVLIFFFLFDHGEQEKDYIDLCCTRTYPHHVK